MTFIKDGTSRLVVAYSNGRASVEHALATDEAFRTVHSNGAHHVLSQVLRHLQNQPDRVVQDLQRRQDRRQAFVESDIDNGPDDLAHLSDRTLARELVYDLAAGARGGRGRGLLRRSGSRGGVMCGA